GHAKPAPASTDPPRRRRRRQTTQGRDWRSLGRAARGTELRARRRPVSKTQTEDRARVRALPPQQRCHPVPPKRPHGGAHRVAINDDDPQPHQAPPSPDSHHGSLKRPEYGDTPLQDGPITNAAISSEPYQPAPPALSDSL